MESMKGSKGEGSRRMGGQTRAVGNLQRGTTMRSPLQQQQHGNNIDLREANSQAISTTVTLITPL